MVERTKLERYLSGEIPQKMSITDALRRYLSSARARSADMMDCMKFNQFCNILELRGLEHSEGYFHYTTWSNFVKMILGNGTIPPYRLLLGTCSRMNDADDRECGDDVYFASFSYGKDENLAMWQVYGSPRPCERGEKEDGIRIRFPWKAILKWFVSGQGEKQMLGVRDNRTFPLRSDPLHFSDVGYYQQQEEYGESISPKVYYRRKIVRMKPYGWFEALKSESTKRILFKRSGWSYENEVRLNVRCPTAQSDFVAINFRIPLEMVLASPEKCILFSPWFDKDRALSCLEKLAARTGAANETDKTKLESIVNLSCITSKYRDCAKPICEKCGLMNYKINMYSK